MILWPRIFMYDIKVAYLKQGEKNNASSLIQMKVKTDKTKTNVVETVF